MLTNIREALEIPRDWLTVMHPHLPEPSALKTSQRIPACYTDMQTLDNGWRLGLTPCGKYLYFTPSESAKRRARKLKQRAAH